tara:strand:- start:389 stop:613 length:225 start_codon:yes stop_codon:yes gene_type:complete
MDLIPITKIRIDKNKWLSTLIKYETDIYNNDITNDITEMILQWILEKDDLIIISDPSDIKASLLIKLLPYQKTR